MISILTWAKKGLTYFQIVSTREIERFFTALPIPLSFLARSCGHLHPHHTRAKVAETAFRARIIIWNTFSAKTFGSSLTKHAITDYLLKRESRDGIILKQKCCRKGFPVEFSLLDFYGSSYNEMSPWCAFLGSARYDSLLPYLNSDMANTHGKWVRCMSRVTLTPDVHFFSKCLSPGGCSCKISCWF